MAEPANSLTAEPSEPPSPRWHGNLDLIKDSERRALRPVGESAHEVAVRTGTLLADLLSLPSASVFHWVLPAAEGVPPVAHAVCAGRRVMLIEAVAWPPGRYDLDADGRIHCDGVYIGQSVGPLTAAVRHWRGRLPLGHRVSALVIVHPAGQGELALPDAIGRDLAWALGCDALRDIRACLPAGHAPVNTKTLAALTAATALW
jgi:hypothetical protein